MPYVPNPIMTPAILPTDIEVAEDNMPQEADELETGVENSPEDEAAETPDAAVTTYPKGGARDEPDMRRLLDSYAPNAR